MPTNIDRAEEHRRAAEEHRKIAEEYRTLGDGAVLPSVQKAYYRVAEGHDRLAEREDEAAFAAQSGYKRLIDLNR